MIWLNKALTDWLIHATFPCFFSSFCSREEWILTANHLEYQRNELLLLVFHELLDFPHLVRLIQVFVFQWLRLAITKNTHQINIFIFPSPQLITTKTHKLILFDNVSVSYRKCVVRCNKEIFTKILFEIYFESFDAVADWVFLIAYTWNKLTVNTEKSKCQKERERMLGFWSSQKSWM